MPSDIQYLIICEICGILKLHLQLRSKDAIWSYAHGYLIDNVCFITRATGNGKINPNGYFSYQNLNLRPFLWRKRLSSLIWLSIGQKVRFPPLTFRYREWARKVNTFLSYYIYGNLNSLFSRYYLLSHEDMAIIIPEVLKVSHMHLRNNRTMQRNILALCGCSDGRWGGFFCVCVWRLTLGAQISK